MRTVGLMLLGSGLLIGADVVEGTSIWGRVLEGSALIALVSAFGYLLKAELPALRKERTAMRAEQFKSQEAYTAALAETRAEFMATLDKITDKWNGWERIRHEDHEEQQSVLRDLTGNCATSRAAMANVMASRPCLRNQDIEELK